MLRTIVSALIALSLASASCKRKGAEPAPAQPPPVALGKCLVSRWVGNLPVDQTCAWTGYSWHCVTDPAKGGADVICDREAESHAEVPVHAGSDAGVPQ